MATAVSEPAASSVRSPEFKQKLQELRRTDNTTNFFYLLWIYGVLAAVVGGAVAFSVNREAWTLSAWWNVPVLALAVLAVGACQHQLTGLAHEAAHHTLFRNRSLNELASDWFCMFPLFSTTHHYRLQHLAHHQFVNDPERDPDVSQLQSSGHWLDFPVTKGEFGRVLLRQLWLPNLFRYVRVRARYSAVPTDKNPYVLQGWKPSKLPVRVGVVYLLALTAVLGVLAYGESPALLAAAPAVILAGVLAVFAALPERHYSKSRIRPVIPVRVMTLQRMTFNTLLLTGVAWLTRLYGWRAPALFLLLWVTPIFTSFALFMVLRQIVQHGNGGRGWLTNTRVFLVHRLVRFCVLPMGQDYHLPHHLFATVPHYRLRRLHRLLSEDPQYREEAVVVEGCVRARHDPPARPTVLDVLGPDWAPAPGDVYIDDTVLDAEDVEEKAEILREGKAATRAGRP
jgi:fatty acid desaturase